MLISGFNTIAFLLRIFSYCDRCEQIFISKNQLLDFTSLLEEAAENE